MIKGRKKGGKERKKERKKEGKGRKKKREKENILLTCRKDFKLRNEEKKHKKGIIPRKQKNGKCDNRWNATTKKLL